MKSNKNQQNNKINSKEQVVQNKTDQLQIKESVSASKDGFRYDYDDSSDF
ncbi:hypothetical protein [Peribacillus asahii]|uniref:Uncharacterized protein n=1 Tax=Peribacillus asahii TaxID=228899 RepID=A0A3Q9RLR8_9BACI|nr:hypothetical protein [Peribacillus asahii]AZV41705.1 hypothetical protein BAOM_1094 [Peribacillus asahii]USK86046.1 hypothetical protein LIT35_05210 [Peribacillus asahii]